jgi:pimeloyl-ACP methyl ester carboxylesterase
VLAVLSGFAALLGILWAFTAIASRRIEGRFPPLGERVEIGGGAIHVVDRAAEGEERGVALLVHGASGNSADMSVALGERLRAKGFRTLSVDRPGHGWSDRIAGRAASSPERQADMLRRAAERLGVAQAVVVAHSLAGVTGLAMALNSPEFVRALVLVAPVSHPWPGGVSWHYSLGAHALVGPPFRRLLTTPIGMALMRSGLASVFSPNPTPPGFIEATHVPLVLRPLHFRANCEDVVAAQAAVAALSPRYREIRAPTEIVTGDRDGVVYAHIHSAGCARDIAGARLTTLAGVGHAPHHVAPDRIVEIILRAERRASERGKVVA